MPRVEVVGVREREEEGVPERVEEREAVGFHPAEAEAASEVVLVRVALPLVVAASVKVLVRVEPRVREA